MRNVLPSPPQVIELDEDVLKDIYEDMVADSEISMEQSGLFDVE